MRSLQPDATGVGISIFDVAAGNRTGTAGSATRVQAGPRWGHGSAHWRQLWHTGNLRPRIVAWGRLVHSVRRNAVKLARYAGTSVAAFGVSEAVLLVLYGSGILNATTDAFLANLAGTVPSYLLSRYWIWREASRRRVGRQVVLYWFTSLLCMVITSLTIGGMAQAAPDGRAPHLVVVGLGFFVISFLLWVAKFLVYERVIFPSLGVSARHPGVPAEAQAHDVG